ncbi:hypothetical protein MNV49_001127 [Pseudohyphozyma bogoriensis]|nr:hypothetical protein MNV49_001127 [Pseudohyphozyma bogoriensis]
MAESSYRQSLQGFAWARPGAVTDDSAAANEGTAFGRWTSSISGYIPVRSGDRSNEEEAYFALSRWERFSGFLLCCAGAGVCFMISFFIGLPLLAVKPRKFAVSFSLGSILFMVGFSVLQGPLAHLKHILTPERLPFTGAYVGSLVGTLFFALAKKSYIPTLVFAIIQCGALISYFVAYFPGGMATLSFGSRMALRGAGNMLPV